MLFSLNMPLLKIHDEELKKSKERKKASKSE